MNGTSSATTTPPALAAPVSAVRTPPSSPPRRDDAVARMAGEKARLTAATILDVLAGNRSPGDAASALGLSVARYYTLEQQAIAALIAGCDPKPPGRPVDHVRAIGQLTAENRRLTQALLRQQALVRAGQRTLGLALPARPDATTPSGRKKRRPVVRALRAVKRLNGAASPTPPTAATVPPDRSGG